MAKRTPLLDTTNIQEAKDFEERLPVGSYEVRFYMTSPISQDQLNELHDYLLDKGLDVIGRLEQNNKGLWHVNVVYQRHEPGENIGVLPLVFPAAAIGLVIPLAIMVLVGIGIFRVGELAKSLTPLILGTLAAVVAAIYVTGKAVEKTGGIETVKALRR